MGGGLSDGGWGRVWRTLDFGLGFWSFNLKYQFLTTSYLILLCGDVESNPGPNLHNLQTFEDYEKHKANANLYPCFVYSNIRNVNNTKKFRIFCSSRTHKHALLSLKHG